MEKPDVESDRRAHPGHLHRAEDHQPRTRAPPSAPSPRSTIICACCSRASGAALPRLRPDDRDAQTAQQMVDQIMALPEGTRLDPAGADDPRPQGRVPRGVSAAAQARASSACASTARSTSWPRDRSSTRNYKHDIDVVVDRLVIAQATSPHRLADSSRRAWSRRRHGRLLAMARHAVANGGNRQCADPAEERTHDTRHLFCPLALPDSGISLPEIEPRTVLVQHARTVPARTATVSVPAGLRRRPDRAGPELSLEARRHLTLGQDWSTSRLAMSKPGARWPSTYKVSMCDAVARNCPKKVQEVHPLRHQARRRSSSCYEDGDRASTRRQAVRGRASTTCERRLPRNRERLGPQESCRAISMAHAVRTPAAATA